MGEDKGISVRKAVNTIAIVTLFVQLFSLLLNLFTMKIPATTTESLYQYFIIILFFCSEIVVLFFILLYNFKCKFLQNRFLKVFCFIIVILAAYIHIWQLFIKQIFILTSIIFLLMDSYIIYRIFERNKDIK